MNDLKYVQRVQEQPLQEEVESDLQKQREELQALLAQQASLNAQLEELTTKNEDKSAELHRLKKERHQKQQRADEAASAALARDSRMDEQTQILTELARLTEEISGIRIGSMSESVMEIVYTLKNNTEHSMLVAFEPTSARIVGAELADSNCNIDDLVSTAKERKSIAYLAQSVRDRLLDQI